MTGWKTKVASISAVSAGIVRICQGLLAEPLNAQEVYEGVLAVIGGLGLWGIGHKIEKNKV